MARGRFLNRSIRHDKRLNSVSVEAEIAAQIRQGLRVHMPPLDTPAEAVARAKRIETLVHAMGAPA